ncbi:hypothetical protein JAAARDRAFT_31437 [Jaapia argillacea MUCL 33604]|uniref:F-box domain-containing protein n=1 Tax=Jaapia argillacea MUCL 33604 TaxID=933084 RepID=A0A067Q4I3_9AGAM|nr:hypothetical protein JAAARDRAFT_31437 [Jaapia argillacea MUCL 33604]
MERNRVAPTANIRKSNVRVAEDEHTRSWRTTPAIDPDPTAPTLYMPIASPPTPAPSPRPLSSAFPPILAQTFAQNHFDDSSLRDFAGLSPTSRRNFLALLLHQCTPSELLYISTTIAPLLRRDFIKELPAEIAFHILSFVTDPNTLARASQVSRCWRDLLRDEYLWKRMCEIHDYQPDEYERRPWGDDDDEEFGGRNSRVKGKLREGYDPILPSQFSYRHYFTTAYSTMTNWRKGGHLLRAHRVPIVTPDSGVITSLAIDSDWIVVGLANCRIHVFSAKTGVLTRTLVGHELGVWAVNLVSKGGHWGGKMGTVGNEGDDGAKWRWEGHEESRRDTVQELSAGIEGMYVDAHVRASVGGVVPPLVELEQLVPPSLRVALGLDTVNKATWSRFRDEGGYKEGEVPRPSDVCSASEGWGQANALVVSGGCDKVVRVWDVKTGYCIYVLHGHTSTIRCIKVLHNRPIAVSGSRDCTVRVWDVQRGRMLRVLAGHQQSVRCLDVFGNKVVSGSYDCTCRLWDIDTGECIYVLRGHFHQIYSVAYDGIRIASGGLDTTVRVWDAASGLCVALLQGHTALVCQLQLSHNILATGGSDGRVITFSLSSPPPSPPTTNSTTAPTTTTTSSTYAIKHRIAAHDSSVTSLQFDEHLLVTGGNDGRVRLFETKTGRYIRELSEPCESVWKVAYRKDVCAIMCKRAGKTVMEIWSFRPREETSAHVVK